MAINQLQVEVFSVFSEAISTGKIQDGHLHNHGRSFNIELIARPRSLYVLSKYGQNDQSFPIKGRYKHI